ncbi:MAG: S8 family serine peptidase [Bacteroidia bacterium]|nr:S8 family serine peptidase [Bacteroidia bacterium]
MAINILSVLFTFLFTLLVSNPSGNTSSYLVYLTDKNTTEVTDALAKQQLSKKTIEKRIRKDIPFNTYDLPVSNDYVLELKQRNSVVKQKSKWLNAVLIESNNIESIEEIKTLPFVKSIQKLSKAKVKHQPSGHFKNSIIDHNSFNKLSRLKTQNEYGMAYNQIEMVNGVALHNKGQKGEEMTIAVFDAGFVSVGNLSLFDEMFAEGRYLGAYDFVIDSTKLSAAHTHGTQVLSIMVGNNPGEYIGTAPNANYWLFRTEDVFAEYLAEEFFWAMAAEYADSVGVDIINSSLGYTTFDDPTENHTYNDMDGNTTPITIAADIAASKGILVVNSAGNSGNSSWFYIGAPADGDSVLAIGGADSTGTYTSFSSKGPSFDGDIKPNVSAQAEGTWIANPWANGIGKGNGTSFSGPIIAGMAACLWQAHPTKTNIDVMRAIEKSCHQYDNPDEFLGFGIPDFVLADAILSGINVQDFNKDEIVNLYPNPTPNNFTISYYSSTDQFVEVELIDVSGRLVQQKSLVLDARSLTEISFATPQANGIYIVNISSTKSNLSKRIILN